MGYMARGATFDDLEEIGRLFAASDRAVGVRPRHDATYLRWRWSQPYLDLERDTRVVTRDGRVAAFLMTLVEPEGGPLMTLGRTHPDDRGRGLGSWVLDRFEHDAANRHKHEIRAWCSAEDAAALALFASRAYRQVRSSIDMGCGLAGDEVAGSSPAGVTIRPFERGRDERELWRALNEAFRDHWDFTGDRPFDVFVDEWFGDEVDPPHPWLAEVEGLGVGGCGWVATPEGAYVISVGVVREQRGRGIATALLRAAMADAAGHGLRDVSLSVDATNPTGATRVYEKVGMRVLRTMHILDKTLA